jgi:hypothetical protein
MLEHLDDAPHAAARAQEYDRKCLIPLNATTSQHVLVCPNAIDGSPLIYRDLVDRLTPAFSVYSFDARNPLLEHRPFESVRETAEYYLEQLTIARPTGPYRFFGFSSGGLLALEMARQLRARGAQVPLVVLGDTQMEEHRPLELGARLGWLFFAEIFIAKDIANVVGWGPLSGLPFWALTEDEKIEFLSTLRPSSRESLALAREETLRDFEVFKRYLRAYVVHDPIPYEGDVVYLSSGIPRVFVDRWVAKLHAPRCAIVELGLKEHLQLVKPPGVAKTAEFLLNSLGHARHD